MRGIEKKRGLQDRVGGEEPPPWSMRINRIVVRYRDGRALNFEPEARRPWFSEDDILELVKVFERASSAAEWAEVGDPPDAGSR
jgi:hypothetical protein